MMVFHIQYKYNSRSIAMQVRVVHLIVLFLCVLVLPVCILTMQRPDMYSCLYPLDASFLSYKIHPLLKKESKLTQSDATDWPTFQYLHMALSV